MDPRSPRTGELLHFHGTYERLKRPTGQETTTIDRYKDPTTNRTYSILPPEHIPYRPVEVERLVADFDQRAERGCGPDPPPKEVEAGCLRRAWKRLGLRSSRLRQAFGQLIDAVIASPEELWRQIRAAKTSLPDILGFLFQNHNVSLLGDYRCCQLA